MGKIKEEIKMQSVIYNLKNFKLNSIFIKLYGFHDAFPWGGSNSLSLISLAEERTM